MENKGFLKLESVIIGISLIAFSTSFEYICYGSTVINIISILSEWRL